MNDLHIRPRGSELEYISSLWWPASDRHAHLVLPKEGGPAIKEVMPYVRDYRACVQAGGNVGVWPLALAQHFTQTYTFEPEALNYECLRRNVAGKNIVPIHAALGAHAGSIGMQVNLYNTGAHYIRGSGDVPLKTIDSLGLNACGLIWLDVEGYELFALQGAEETIARCHPVIVLEVGGLSDHYYKVPRGAEGTWLLWRGYRFAKQMGRECVYI